MEDFLTLYFTGSYNCGNETKFAEWNFHCDPLAADLVLRGYSPEQVKMTVYYSTL